MPIMAVVAWLAGVLFAVPLAYSWSCPVALIWFGWWLWRRVTWWWWTITIIWLGWQLSVIQVVPLGSGWQWLFSVWRTLSWPQWLGQGVVLIVWWGWEWWRRRRHVATNRIN
jgi:hypothetical protein